MRITASWSGSEPTHRIQVCGAGNRADRELFPRNITSLTRWSDAAECAAADLSVKATAKAAA